VFNCLVEADCDLVRPLENDAQRVLTLAEGRGCEALSQVANQQLQGRLRDEYDAQPDALSRSAWAFLSEPRIFEVAESLFYANHYRNFGKIYEAYEVDLDGMSGLDWNPELAQALECRITEMLGLKGRCTVSYLSVPRAGNDRDAIMLIIRHGGPLSSVADHRDDGQRRTIYYRPPNEATLIFSPETGMIELCAESPWVRQQLAQSFAEVALGHDLSSRPLTLKQYELSRFFDSLSLPAEAVDGYDIERAAVVEVDAKPNNLRHRVSLKVTAEDDIDDIARRLLGPQNIFNRAAVISRVVIAVKYSRDGEAKTRTLNITLSCPNRCNLRSNRDPDQRDLGFALLDKWGILKTFRPLAPAEERALFPELLALHDCAADTISGQYLQQRGLDADVLSAAGFIERKGRHTSVLVDEDDGGPCEVEVGPAASKGHVLITSPMDGKPVVAPNSAVAKFAINRSWLEETLLKALKPFLATPAMQRLDDNLVSLGVMKIDSVLVPCYFARRLTDPKVLRTLDASLRGRGGHGVGIVLSAGLEGPNCLGPNVVVPLVDHLGPDADCLATEGLAIAFRSGRQMALGGMTVHLAKCGPYTATLYLPGKCPYTLTGANQIKIVERLVNAYQSGSPAVLTHHLIADTGVNSPSQAFRDWNAIKGVYIGQAGKRGSWQLIT
jgi:hypothetical protein